MTASLAWASRVSKSRSRAVSVSSRNASRSRSVAKRFIRISGHVATNRFIPVGRSFRPRIAARGTGEEPCRCDICRSPSESVGGGRFGRLKIIESGLDKATLTKPPCLFKLLDVTRRYSTYHWMCLKERLMETKWLIVIEAAQYLKMGRSTVYKLAQEGKLPTHKVGRQ